MFFSEKSLPNKRILLISDLWGWQSAPWLMDYLKNLSANYSIVICDSCAMAEIEPMGKSEKEIHHQFVNGGIEKAVSFLLEQHGSNETPMDILAFSVGATIAWKAILKGMNIDVFYGVSGTRLRYEDEKPDVVVKLLYGSEDEFKPRVEWFEKLNLEMNLIEGEEHDIYKQEKWGGEICKELFRTKIK